MVQKTLVFSIDDMSQELFKIIQKDNKGEKKYIEQAGQVKSTNLDGRFTTQSAADTLGLNLILPVAIADFGQAP